MAFWQGEDLLAVMQNWCKSHAEIAFVGNSCLLASFHQSCVFQLAKMECWQKGWSSTRLWAFQKDQLILDFAPENVQLHANLPQISVKTIFGV